MSEYGFRPTETRRLITDPDEAIAKLLKKPVDRIELDQFTDLYADTAIKQDQAHIRSLKESMVDPAKSEAGRLAMVFEKVFTDQVELNDWLGPNVVTVGASEYDDIVNGVDTIAQFETETANAYLGCALDVTISTAKMRQKLERNRREIENGSLTTVKYFASPDETFRGQLEKVPRVIIGVSGETVKNLALLSANRDNTKLAEHPVRFQILDELVMQLETYAAYADRVGQTQLLRRFEQPLAIVRQTYRDIQSSLTKYQRAHRGDSYDRTDRIYKDLNEQLKQIFGT